MHKLTIILRTIKLLYLKPYSRYKFTITSNNLALPLYYNVLPFLLKCNSMFNSSILNLIRNLQHCYYYSIQLTEPANCFETL